MNKQKIEGIREFRLEDIPDIVRINNITNPKIPMSIEGQTAIEENRNPADPLQQWVIERDGKVVAYADSGVVHGTSAESTFHVIVMVDPEYGGQGLGYALLQEAVEFARSHNITKLIGVCAEDDPRAVRWMERNEFKPVGKNAEIELDLTQFDPSTHDYLSVIEGLGVNLSTIKQEKTNHEDAERVLFDTLADPLIREIELPGDAKIEMEFDTFKSLIFDRPDADDGDQILAIKNGEFVAWCSLLLGEREAAYMNFIGARSDFRHKGLEISMIQHAIKVAKSKGFKRITTHIEGIKPEVLNDMAKIGWITQPGRLICCKYIG